MKIHFMIIQCVAFAIMMIIFACVREYRLTDFPLAALVRQERERERVSADELLFYKSHVCVHTPSTYLICLSSAKFSQHSDSPVICIPLVKRC